MPWSDPSLPPAQRAQMALEQMTSAALQCRQNAGKSSTISLRTRFLLTVDLTRSRRFQRGDLGIKRLTIGRTRA
jgi:hypothetical protein